MSSRLGVALGLGVVALLGAGCAGSEEDARSQEAPTSSTDCDTSALPPTWPGEMPSAVAGGEVLELDLVAVLGDLALCGDLAVADELADGLGIPTPDLGSAELDRDGVLRYTPPTPPDDAAAPERPWWGQDRVRVCVEDGSAARACTNVDLVVHRSEVARLIPRLEELAAATGSSLPALTLLHGFARSGMLDAGTPPGGAALVQEGHALAWAAAVASLPLCPGAEADHATSLRAEIAAQAAPHDMTAVELAAATGQSPAPGLATSSQATLTMLAELVEACGPSSVP